LVYLVLWLRKFFVFTFLAAAFLAVAVASVARVPERLVVYSAPTLEGVSEDLAALYSGGLDVRVMGSVLAANLIKSGKVPDLFLTVDSELKHGLNYRNEYVIGVYRQLLVCNGYETWWDALKEARISLANPNIAPIGYRSLAAIYLLSEMEGLGIISEIQDRLNVSFSVEDGGLVIDARSFTASGRFYARDDLNGAYTLLQNGVVDCTFAHAPFVNQKNLWTTHNVIELPEYARFQTEPPLKITAKLIGSEVVVSRFVAAAYSFTEKGDRLLSLLDKVDYSKYQIERMGG